MQPTARAIVTALRLMPDVRATIPLVASMREPCPGCGALFASHSGPTHRYIGASAGCWAMYSEWLIGSPPSNEVLALSEAPQRDLPPVAAPEWAGALVVDAYAAQHHGNPSPQAIQSVAVHLLALHGTLRRGVDPPGALWVRQRALRQRGVFQWLSPPNTSSAFTIRHLFPSAGGSRICSPSEYVASVYSAWAAVHDAQLDAWYREYVEDNEAAP